MPFLVNSVSIGQRSALHCCRVRRFLSLHQDCPRIAPKQGPMHNQTLRRELSQHTQDLVLGGGQPILVSAMLQMRQPIGVFLRSLMNLSTLFEDQKNRGDRDDLTPLVGGRPHSRLSVFNCGTNEPKAASCTPQVLLLLHVAGRSSYSGIQVDYLVWCHQLTAAFSRTPWPSSRQGSDAHMTENGPQSVLMNQRRTMASVWVILCRSFFSSG
jgi:hypothetical protein